MNVKIFKNKLKNIMLKFKNVFLSKLKENLACSAADIS